jgi:hypothetical protein
MDQSIDDFYMENPAFPNDYAISWLYEPEDWSTNENKSVVIEISKKASLDTAAFYKITLFLTTGTFHIQGNYKNKFTVNDFHSLKALLIRIAGFNKNSESQDETNVKQLHEDDQQASVASNTEHEGAIRIEKELSNCLTKFDKCNVSSTQ